MPLSFNAKDWAEASLPKWLVDSLGVLAIVVGTFILWALVRRAAHRARKRFEVLQAANNETDPRSSIAAAQRLTALQLVVNGARYAIFTAGTLLVFSRAGLLQADSLLFPAGFFGAALGLGGQNLVRDVVAGLFIVFEGQFAVGDHVKINGVTGRVVEVGLRVTCLRDENGQMHFFPNGAITTVARTARSTTELHLWVPLCKDSSRAALAEVVSGALEDFDAVFGVWNDAPQLLDNEGKTQRVQFALRVQPAQLLLVREKLPARISGALEAAGMKNEAGAAVEITAAPAV